MKILENRGVAVLLSSVLLVCNIASGAVVHAVFNSSADIPITSSNYTATGKTIDFALNFAPGTGTDLTVIRDTALAFISGTFDNLTNGQPVSLSYAGLTCNFAANYYGGVATT